MLKRTITITMREGDCGLLENLAGHHPLLTRHRAAELALHHGLTDMHADRTILDRAINEAAESRRTK